MDARAAEMMLRCVFEGSITMQDSLIERRPYHRNCDCALHKLKGVCSSVCSRTTNISFPKRQPWDNCSLSLSESYTVRSPEEVNAASYVTHSIYPDKETQQAIGKISTI